MTKSIKRHEMKFSWKQIESQEISRITCDIHLLVCIGSSEQGTLSTTDSHYRTKIPEIVLKFEFETL